MEVFAKITGIKYMPFLCRDLNVYNISELGSALSKNGSFLLDVGLGKRLALSWWVSPKRTRSYPYARVYDTLNFQGKKATIIPIIKDEGLEGDRDFLQWDTISLMSLLGVYTIISYYSYAERSRRYDHKITNQRFDLAHIRTEIRNLLTYQSDALHWNIAQIEKVGVIAKKSLDSYEKISKELCVEMHSKDTSLKRVYELIKGKESFIDISRELAKKAQIRETMTKQPKERLSGVKASLTIKNYLGGYYFFTCDEAQIEKKIVYLVEGKHSSRSILPSLDDIKDGLIKMILFTNLKDVKICNTSYIHLPILKLTSNLPFSTSLLSNVQISNLKLLKKEAKTNDFRVLINDADLEEIIL